MTSFEQLGLHHHFPSRRKTGLGTGSSPELAVKSRFILSAPNQPFLENALLHDSPA